MPFLYRNPNDAASTAGPGDLELQNKFLLWKSVQHLVLLSGGFELRLPSGSERRGLGGEIAVGWPLSRWFTPLLELNTVSKIQGQEGEDAVKLRGRTQLYLTPGFNVRPLPGATFRMGVELPVSGRREFDYRIHAGLVWE